mmetsp:Transcript_5618/g.19788  ORF Transcript_5618/g.19788 Transcript_5618/m.19788 type:complete len:1322 (-) Transcript_5618:141-4106(-)
MASVLLAPDAMGAQSLLLYFARKKMHRHIHVACSQLLNKRVNDPVLLFWRAYAVMMEGRITEAVSEFEALRGNPAVQLAALVCLKAAHEKTKFVDREAVQSVTKAIFDEEKQNKEGSFFMGALVCLLRNDFKKARDYISKVLEFQPNYPQAKSVNGWIELLSGTEIKAKKSIELFEAAMEANPNDIEAVLGKAAFLERYKPLPEAIEFMNQFIVKFSWFAPAITEKARLLIAGGDWDQAIESVNRALNLDGNNLDALMMSALHALVKESKFSVASQRIGELFEIIKECEPYNPEIICTCASVFSRLCARNTTILNQCIQMMKMVTEMERSSVYMAELAYQYFLMSNFKEALQRYQEAYNLDELNMNAAYWKIICQIFLGDMEEASQQFEFLNAIHGDSATGKSTELCYIGALLAMKLEKNTESSIMKLEETATFHMEQFNKSSISFDYIIRFNPDFLLQIARDLLEYAGSECPPEGESPSPVLSKAIKILDGVSKLAPGMLEVQILLAKSRYLARDFEGAQSALTDAIQMDPTHYASHMLMAQIYMEMGRFNDANSSLELALSHNFEIRESPVYFLLKSIIHERSGEWSQALKVLESAMKLPGVKKASTARNAPSQDQRASIFIHLAKVQNELGQTHEASKTIQDAKGEFHGTPSHAQIILLDAELALKRGDVQSALILLKGISSDSPYYVKAKIAVANIHLNHRHNKKLYLRCYEELVERNETIATLCMLAEAYLRLQEPNMAVEKFKRAKELEDTTGKGSGTNLAAKIGQAMVSSHDFDGAIQYLQSASEQQPNVLSLRLSLAELFMKLGKYDSALDVCAKAKKFLQAADNVEAMISSTKIYLLEAKVHKLAGKQERYKDSLMLAREEQLKILGRMRGEASSLLRHQRTLAANICSDLAKYMESIKNYTESLRFYGEALKHDEKHADAMLSLARLHMDRDELDEAKKQCSALLKFDLEVEAATMMLADIMFRSNDFDDAIKYFAQILERNPNNYKALEQLILLVRRAGRLLDTKKKGRISEATRFLKLAERSSARASFDAGFHYCKGLFCRFSRNLTEALEELNQARKDGEWGAKAITQMIEIYLDTDEVGEELLSTQKKIDNVKMASDLRKELGDKGTEKPVKLQLYAAYEQLCLQTKSSVENAVNLFTDILNIEKDSVSALLGLSLALRLLKQDAKARNHLKRISKMQYNSEEAEEFEKSYLLLADIYIQSNKNDLAQELCRKCLTHNKSCAKAWEYQGLIYEKEASYADAAQVYEMAWQFDNKRNASVGYKLAFNFLKAKRYIDAINICHAVLKLQPGYEKIKTEILEKARGSIRL